MADTQRAPGPAAGRARTVLLALIGTSEWRALGLVILGLILLGWATDAGFEVLSAGFNQGWSWALLCAPHRLTAWGLFIVYLIGLGWLARRASRDLAPVVTETRNPEPVAGLILALSKLSDTHAQQLTEYLDRGLDRPHFETAFEKLPWRMPVEALGYHARELCHVRLLTSRDGSDGQFELLRRLLRQLFPEVGWTSADCLSTIATPGVDFNSVRDIAHALNRGYESLRARGLGNSDILIDITSGTKPVTAAALAVALAEGRRVQYVNERYQVQRYDVRYGE